MSEYQSRWKNANVRLLRWRPAEREEQLRAVRGGHNLTIYLKRRALLQRHRISSAITSYFFRFSAISLT